MNIDFNKLINLLMPTFLRTESLAAIYKAVSTPLVTEYGVFKAWQIDMRLQVAMTCQVMYIEAILNYRLFGNFLRTIYITDGDGIIVDFIVNIPAGITVNGQMLVSLIEKYKLKGKRYSIGQSTVTYEISWTDQVCELVEMIYEASWTDPVCELVEEVLPDIYHMIVYANAVGPDGGQSGETNSFKTVVTIVSSPVAGILSNENIIVTGYIYDIENTQNRHNFELIIDSGMFNSESAFVLETSPASDASCVITSISPSSVIGYDFNTYNVIQ